MPVFFLFVYPMILQAADSGNNNHEIKSEMHVGGYKLEMFGRETKEHRSEKETEESSMASTSTSKISGREWIANIEMGSNVEYPPACFRPLKTLDLFPTYSTGLRDN